MPDVPAVLPAPLADLLRADPRARVVLYGYDRDCEVIAGAGYVAEILRAGDPRVGEKVPLAHWSVLQDSPEEAFAELVAWVVQGAARAEESV